MNNQDYCSYELSKALKAAGFDWRTDHLYRKDADNGDQYTLIHSGFDNYNEHWRASDWCSAPLLFHAQKWLRKKYHISVRVSYISYHKVWFADWLNLDSGEFDDTDATFATYEEALADGIEAALELIKKGE